MSKKFVFSSVPTEAVEAMKDAMRQYAKGQAGPTATIEEVFNEPGAPKVLKHEGQRFGVIVVPLDDEASGALDEV